MNRSRCFKKILSATCALIVLNAVMPDVSYAEIVPPVPAPIATTLNKAAVQGSQKFLVAVYNSVAANPQLAGSIQAQAVAMQPGLASQISHVVNAAQTAAAQGAVAGATGTSVALASATPIGWIAGGVLAVGAVGAGVAVALSGSSGDSLTAEELAAREYARNWGLAAIHASDAYAQGATGSGITVGVLDSGIDSDFSEFAGRIAAGGDNFISSSPNGSIEADSNGINYHGVHVSGIIAANKDNEGMHGVAYQSQILPLRLFQYYQGTTYTANTSDTAAAVAYGMAHGVQIFNASYGYETGNVPVNLLETEFDAYESAINSGAIMVFAAGNDGWADPVLPAALPYVKPANDAAAATAGIYINNTNSKDYSALASQLLAVVSVDRGGAISSFSNRCGVAATWCLAAPGGSIYSTVPNNTYDTISGTSMAAPHVSGALALLMDLYPSLTPAQIVTRLLTTADNTGIYANSAVYGRGMLNLSAATAFVASPHVAMGATVAGPSMTLSSSQFHTSAALGDGLSHSLSNEKVVLIDSFDGAGIAVKADALTVAPEMSNRMDNGLRHFGREATTIHLNNDKTVLTWREIPEGNDGESAKTEGRMTTAFTDDTKVSVGFMDDPSVGLGLMADGAVNVGESRSSGAFISPYMAFASDGMSIATETKLGAVTVRGASFTGHAEDEKDQKAFGAVTELSYAPFKGSNVALQAGFVSEDKTFLGSVSDGAFALGRTDTTFAGLSGRLSLTDKTEMVGSYYMGMSTAQASQSALVGDMSGVQSDAFSLGVIHHDAVTQGDRLGFLVNQPLRVRSGSAQLTLASSVDANANVSYRTVNAGLTPTGREMDLEMFYAAPLAEKTSLNTSVMYRHEPDHVASADDEGQLLVRLNHQY